MSCHLVNTFGNGIEMTELLSCLARIIILHGRLIRLVKNRFKILLISSHGESDSNTHPNEHELNAIISSTTTDLKITIQS